MAPRSDTAHALADIAYDIIPYDIGGPSDLAERGEPVRIVPGGVPRAARNHNYLLEIKTTRDDAAWERSREAYRWVPDAPADPAPGLATEGVTV